MQPAINPDLNAIQKKNIANLKTLENKGSIEYMFAMMGRTPLLLIGGGHDATVMRTVKAGQHHEGVISIKKGEPFGGPGELKVTGMKNRRSEFDGVVRAFSKKKVVYV